MLISLSASCQKKMETEYSLKDFYSESEELSKYVNSIYDELKPEERVAQMIVCAAGRYGKPHEEVKQLVSENVVGGVLLLNGTKDGFSTLVKELNTISENTKAIPQIFSADAEPSLIPFKIKGTTPVPKTSEIKDISECKTVASKISNDLLNIGIHHNYAPVIDISPDNEAIGNRSFGNDPLKVINMAMAFVEQSQEMNIATTVKHFPGHGKVKGDTHEKLVFIDGEFSETKNYVPFIDAGVTSIMVAHLAVKNNENYSTNGFPASCSKAIVTDLLRKEMGYKGIIVTDAMNMGALKEFGNAPLEAAKAGCDMVLMPNNERKLNGELRKILSEKSAMSSQIEQSIKRVIRLKACLGLI